MTGTCIAGYIAVVVSSKGVTLPASPNIRLCLMHGLFFIEVNMFDYKDTIWKRKQKKILKRDGYMCQWCKRYGKKVDATTVHHIKHADEYPELVYTDSNLISLCSACHNKAHPEKAKNHRRY